MTQKLPRNQELHERRHKRKAGAHKPRRDREDPMAKFFEVCEDTCQCGHRKAHHAPKHVLHVWTYLRCVLCPCQVFRQVSIFPKED